MRELHSHAVTHGHTKDKSIPKIYRAWSSMKNRCYSPSSKFFRHYGGRGISVCEEWLNNYEAFRVWAIANKYEVGLQIDRIDNNGNYEPGNCRFVTSTQNNRNTRNNRLITAFGETKCMAAWIEDERCHINRHTLRGRLLRNWPVERAITEPLCQVKT